MLQLRFVPGRVQEWQRSHLAAQSPGAQICEQGSALGLAKVVEGLMDGSSGHKVGENQRRKSGPQKDSCYRLEETVYLWKLGWGNGRDGELETPKLPGVREA